MAIHYSIYILTNILATSGEYLEIVNWTSAFSVIKDII